MFIFRPSRKELSDNVRFMFPGHSKLYNIMVANVPANEFLIVIWQ